MSINVAHAHDVTGTIARSFQQSVPVSTDFGPVCLWSLLGLDLSALAVAVGFATDIAEILALAA